MSALEKEEFKPLLPAGWHAMDLEAARRLCVTRFPFSISRPRIMSLLEDVIVMMQQARMRGEIWLVGSFTTEKMNPDDVDLLLVVSESTIVIK